MTDDTRPNATRALASAPLAGVTAGLALALAETAGAVARVEGAVPASDLALVTTWLALAYGSGLAAAGFAAALLLGAARRVSGFPARSLSASIPAALVFGLAALAWLRSMVILRERAPTYDVLEILVAVAAGLAGALAGLAAFRSSLGAGALAPWRPGVGGILVGLAGLIVLDGSAGPRGLAPRVALAAVAGAVAAGLLAAARSAAARRRPVRFALAGAALVSAAVWIVPAVADFGGLLTPRERTATIGPPRTPPPSGAPNVLFISVDTLRADHVSSYGYPVRTTPSIDRIAGEGVRFRATASTSSFTTPAHASMMTGLYPSTHGAQYQRSDPTAFVISPMLPDVPTLAEVLRDRGYDTAGFVASPMVGSQFGFDRGFEVFDDRCDRLQPMRGQILARTMLYRVLRRAGLFDSRDRDAERKADEVNALVGRWLDGRRDPARPFLLFVHYYDPHTPYASPAGYDPRGESARSPVEFDAGLLLERNYTLTDSALADTVARYDGEIAYVDRHVGDLIERLTRTGDLERTLVVITSDHGESFGEHGHWGHNLYLYEDLLRVPLILRLPGRIASGLVVDEVVAQPTDLLPTILSIAGFESPAGVQGRDLSAHMGKGGRPTHAAVAFAELARNVGWVGRWGKHLDRDLLAARAERWKYIRSSAGAEELYDLLEDPGEMINLASADPETLRALRDLLAGWQRAQVLREEGHGGTIDPGVIENLRSLGYVQ